MKKLLTIVVAVGFGLWLSADISLAASGASGGKVSIKGGPETEHPVAAGTQPKPVASGGKQQGGSGAAASGSSEHSSVRGTINGGGDFIAPKLTEKQPQKPKGVAPKPSR